MNYKKIMRRVAIVFVSAMVLLSFFSVALMDLYTPRVYVAVIAPGDIAPMAVAYGVVTPADTLRVLSPAAGRITAIMPQGSKVDGESVLFEITRDLDAIQLALEEAERDGIAHRIEELTLQVENPVVYMRLDTYPNRVITTLAPGIELGFTVENGAHIMTTAIRNNRFKIETEFSHIHDFIGVGQQVDVVVGREIMAGQATHVALAGGRRRVTIEVENELLIGGELAHITVRGEREPQQNIIPNSALRTNAWGAHYILYLASAARRGYVQAMHVDVIRRDHSNTAIMGQWGAALPDNVLIVVVNSDVPIRDGDRVRHNQRMYLPGNGS